MKRKGFEVAEGDPVEAWKLWLKRRFLGTDNFRISKTEISGQVKRSSNLNKRRNGAFYGSMLSLGDRTRYKANYSIRK